MHYETTDLWHFWNFNFLSRQFPTREIKKHNTHQRFNYPFKCNECGETFRGRRYITHKRRKDVGEYTCPRCHGILLEQALNEARSEEAKKSIEKARQFEDLLADCRKRGTCDILAAHHEAMKDDPDRLKTDFLISLICGTEKAEQYKKTKTGAQS